MNGNCHFSYGAAVSTAIVLNLDKIENLFTNLNNTPETMVSLILGGLVGSIIPDIDNPSSHIGRLSFPVSNTISFLSGKSGSNHRGILHNPLVYIIGIYFSYIYLTPLTGFFIGALSHLFLDAFNPAGIPCMGKKIRFMRIPSGSKESVVFTWANILFVIFLALLFKSSPSIVV